MSNYILKITHFYFMPMFYWFSFYGVINIIISNIIIVIIIIRENYCICDDNNDIIITMATQQTKYNE